MSAAAVGNRFGPKTLACLDIVKKRREFVDPATKMTGRCGNCRTCWRLWVAEMRKLGKAVPRQLRDGSIAGFMFTKWVKHIPRATA